MEAPLPRKARLTKASQIIGHGWPKKWDPGKSLTDTTGDGIGNLEVVAEEPRGGCRHVRTTRSTVTRARDTPPRMRRHGGVRGEGVRRTGGGSPREHVGRARGGIGVPGRGAVCAGGGWRAGAWREPCLDKSGVRRGEVAKHARSRLRLPSPTS